MSDTKSTTQASDFPYLHGFSKEEQARLRRQARFAEYTVFQNLNLSGRKNLLEVGCGVGAQSEILLRRFPEMHVTGIDLSDPQLAEAKILAQNPMFKGRYQVEKMDGAKMSFANGQFDSAFLCWILEHVASPVKVLSEIRRVLAPGSVIYITEVLNSSFFLDPYSPNVWRYWMAFNDYQYANAGDPFVGAKLGNFLLQSGYKDVETTAKTWHLDNRHPQHRKEMIEYWTDLLLSASDQLVKEGAVTHETVEGVKKEMAIVATDPNAVFFYTFMQAKAKV